MLTWTLLSGRRLPDGIIIANPSVEHKKVQPLAKITKQLFNRKGELVQRAKYPILRQTASERSRSSYNMAALTDYRNSDLYLVEATDIQDWSTEISETKPSQIGQEITVIVNGTEVSGTLVEFHNQSPVEGMLTNLIKHKYPAVLKTQQANAYGEFDEMLQELYCGQTSGSIWGWLTIAQTLDCENQSNAQQMCYIRDAISQKLLNRLDRKFHKNYYAETSVSDIESTLRSDEESGASSLYDLNANHWYGDVENVDHEFDDKLARLKAKLNVKQQQALENYLNYVPDDKLFGVTDLGVPKCIKRCEVVAWDIPKDFIQFRVEEVVEFQLVTGEIVTMTIKRLAFDETRQLFKIEAGPSSGETAKLRVFGSSVGLDKDYLRSLAETIETPRLEDATVTTEVSTGRGFADKPALTRYEENILQTAEENPAEFLAKIIKLANKKYDTSVTAEYDADSETFAFSYNGKPGARITKPETLLRLAVGK